ncbi:hypothetical protein [Actinoplanes sp. HUAS TT8]|uniref:hypothetical protein n=1 Tax=Actinoplanes sp. HUAS TT8 TaxID=3447453 RepID=UPI003F52463E
MFDFNGEADKQPPSEPLKRRIAAYSRTFVIMIALAAVALFMLGFALLWTVKAFRA